MNAGTNELVIPNYKQTWGNIRKITDAPKAIGHLSFKSKEYVAGGDGIAYLDGTAQVPRPLDQRVGSVSG